MDTVTHTLFGLVIYQSINKDQMSQSMKRSLLLTSLVGSQIPDIDVVSQWWDVNGQYLMWHRGITHSIFLVPLWALLIRAICYVIWRVRESKIYWIGLLAVFLHITIDNFNAWGTGYFEPISQKRIALGTVPIVDFVIWLIILGGFVATRLKKWSTPRIFKTVGALIALHVLIQTIQGGILVNNYSSSYQQIALAADFIPGSFKLIGKNEGVVEIHQLSLWKKPVHLQTFQSADETDLRQLFEQNKEAQTLYEWAPLVVVVNDEKQLGIFDPRFFRNGESFLYEYVTK